jgi:predicted PurR-regulated permease PerM
MFEVKNLENMSDRELLEELVKEKRRNDILRYVSYAFYAIIMILILVMYFKYAPIIKQMIEDYNQIVKTVNDFSSSIQKITDSINPETFEKINQISESFDPATFEKIKEFSDSFDPEDFKKLKDFVEKFQKLFGAFGM